MKKTLWRASGDDYVDQGYSFAESRATAELYRDNAGFGGSNIYRTRVELTGDQKIDLTDVEMSWLIDELGLQHPGAIGIDEWLPRTVKALDGLRDLGFLWAMVRESYPEDTITWIWLGTGLDDEPVLEQVS